MKINKFLEPYDKYDMSYIKASEIATEIKWEIIMKLPVMKIPELVKSLNITDDL